MSFFELSRDRRGQLQPQAVVVTVDQVESLIRTEVRRWLGAGHDDLDVVIEFRNDGSAIVTATPR